MKRVVLLGFLFSAWCALPVAAQSVTVTKPSAGSNCTIGQACLITWTVSGQPGSKVILELMDKAAPTVVRLIVPEVSIGNLQYSWTIPNDVAAGQYRVQARVYGAPISDIGDVFTIQTSGGPAATIAVTKPASGDTWNREKTYSITWTKNGTMPNSVKIDLLNSAGTNVVKHIADGVPNSGSRSWTIPADTPFGNYLVRVQVKTTQIADDSEVFSIALASNIGVAQKAPSLFTPALKVIDPHESSVATAGGNLPIRFSTDRDLGTVEILLYDEFKNQKKATIAQQVAFGQGQQCPPVGPGSPNQFSYNWEVPYAESFLPGAFTLRIRCYESGAVAWSEKFKIIWPMKEHEYTFECQPSGCRDMLAINDSSGLAPWPTRPLCQAPVGSARVGWSVFDYLGMNHGASTPYWRVFIYYAQLKFPLEQFMGKNTALLKAQLRIKKICTANISTTQSSAAGLLSRLKAAPPEGQQLAQFQAMQKEPLYILPAGLTEASYNVEQTVRDWILKRNPNHGFLLSVANEAPPNADSTCISSYQVKLYVKIQEEFKGYTTN